MSTTTTVQGLPVPEAADDVDVPGDMMSLAQAVETKLVMVFDNSGARDAAIPAPTDGMLCCLADSNSYQVFSDAEWRTFFTGDAPGSGISYGHISSYQTSPPADARNGAVAVDRDTQQVYTKDNSGIWRPLAAGAAVANTSYRYGGAGFTTAEGASSNCCSMNVTTTVANTKVRIDAIALYSLLGVGVFAGVYGGWQDVATVVMVTPPGGSLTELKRFTNREMNTGGTGTSTVGGPTPRTVAAQHIYTCATAGTYSFVLRLSIGTGGQGQVANIGGEMTVQPVVTVSTF